MRMQSSQSSRCDSAEVTNLLQLRMKTSGLRIRVLGWGAGTVPLIMDARRLGLKLTRNLPAVNRGPVALDLLAHGVNVADRRAVDDGVGRSGDIIQPSGLPQAGLRFRAHVGLRAVAERGRAHVSQDDQVG